MSSKRRRWLWLGIVALAAAALWQSLPDEKSTVRAPSAPAAAEPREQPRQPEPATGMADGARTEEAPIESGEPSGRPLPRDQVELPGTHRAPDAGVATADMEVGEKRDQMLTTVLDRLKRDLREARDAGDEEGAAQLEVRIGRLERRRDELAKP